MVNLNQVNFENSPSKKKGLQKKKSSNLIKAISEATREFYSESKEGKTSRYIIVFTSTFDVDYASDDEKKKLIFILHQMKINLIIFGFEIDQSQYQQKVLNDKRKS